MIDLKTGSIGGGAIGGVSFVVSVHAMAKPSGMPQTDDMKEFVDHMERLGQIRYKPAAFMADGRVLIHPELMDDLHKRVAVQLGRQMDSFYGLGMSAVSANPKVSTAADILADLRRIIKDMP